MSEKWRIEQLSAWVGKALSRAEYDGQASARVREFPDVRTIRYYTTLGLLDRPLEMRGRTAFYGRRHLLQLVAIKRLQAQGCSLVDVQERLAGASQRQLESLAALPRGLLDAAQPDAGAEHRKETSRSRGASGSVDLGAAATDNRSRSKGAFWAAAPALRARKSIDAASGAPLPFVMVPLGDRISLLIEGAGAELFDEETLAALEPAGALVREVLQGALLRKPPDSANTNSDDTDSADTDRSTA